MRCQGLSYRKIATTLNEEKVSTPRDLYYLQKGMVNPRQDGGYWQAQTVKAILRNEKRGAFDCPDFGAGVPGVEVVHDIFQNHQHLIVFVSGVHWQAQTVKAILRNEVYIGHTVQNKTGNISYKVHKQVGKPEAEWIRVALTAHIENTPHKGRCCRVGNEDVLVIRAFQIADRGIASHILPGLKRGAFDCPDFGAGVPGVEVVHDIWA